MNIIKTYFNKEIEIKITIEKDYAALVEQYIDALEHAAVTKGKERHANNLPFEKQKICRINRDVGIGYGLGQIIKKAEEVINLPPDRAILELLGVINYASGVIIVLKELLKDNKDIGSRMDDIKDKNNFLEILDKSMAESIAKGSSMINTNGFSAETLELIKESADKYFKTGK